jgi:hypothetical protein
MKIPLILILFFVISCRNGINSKTSDNTKDTLHFPNELTNSEDSLPLQGEGKIISLFELDSFCINKKYSYDGLQGIELITNQEEFEEIAEREYPNKNKMPMIDFSKNYLLALVIANKKPRGMGYRGYESTNILLRLDSCKRYYNSIGIDISLIEIEKTQGYKQRQLHLYQIKLDKNLEKIGVWNSYGRIGRDLEFSRYR